MKLLVTGGAGFIGSNFIRYWLTEHPDDEVRNFDKLTYAGNLENLRDVEKNQRYRFIKGDICDVRAVEDAMKGVDVVVHFAAESHVDRSILSPEAFVRTNVLGTGILLQAALKNRVSRFHHISTDEVFGMLPLDTIEKWNEKTPYAPRSPYSASKAGADHLVRAFHTTYGLPVTISNCSNNIGPYCFPEKFLPLAITNLLEGKKVPVYKPGNQMREWLYVEDHCHAIDTILTEGRIGETYFVGSDHDPVSNLELIKMVLNLMGMDEDKIELVGDRPGHDVRYGLDCSKIKDELGWEQQVSLDRALQLTVAWYQENQDWWKRVKSGAYKEYYEQQYGDR